MLSGGGLSHRWYISITGFGMELRDTTCWFWMVELLKAFRMLISCSETGNARQKREKDETQHCAPTIPTHNAGFVSYKSCTGSLVRWFPCLSYHLKAGNALHCTAIRYNQYFKYLNTGEGGRESESARLKTESHYLLKPKTPACQIIISPISQELGLTNNTNT